MRTIIILLMLISVQASAGYELETRTTNMKYKWGSVADFPLTLRQIGLAYKNEYGYGYSVMAGQSDTKQNNLQNVDVSIALRDFWTLSVFRSFRISENLSFAPCLTYTEYKQVDKWGGNSDTDLGYGVGVEYKIDNKYSAKLSYNHYYDKISSYVGKETTTGYGLSVIYRF